MITRRPNSKYSRFQSGLHVEQLEARLFLASGPLISEFMASNNSALADGDGQFSDWIELYNPTSETIDLTGWHLTDSADSLAKWTFPNAPIVPRDVLELEPAEYLVVFASGQEIDDYVDAGGHLHTNFKLGADGEYLALVDPGGAPVHEYAPEFPPQTSDISYGLAMASSETMLVGAATHLHYLVPTNGALGMSWTEVGFNDDSWMGAGGEDLIAGIGYENNPNHVVNYASRLNTTVPSGTTSLYTRFEFDVVDPQIWDTLVLRMMYDDGFVAYLNGVEVARDYFTGTPQWDSSASGGRGDSVVIEDFVEFDISTYRDYLVPGANVLAVHGLNLGATSSDMLMMAELVGGMVGPVEPLDPGYFRTPTPHAANGTSFAGYVEDTQFSVDRGFYTEAFDVEITTDTDGAMIVYTTDGSEPQVDAAMHIVNGHLYTEAVPIAATTILRAAAFKFDYQPANTDTQTYLFLADVLLQSPNGQAPVGFPASPVNGQVFDYGMDPNIVNDPVWGPQLIDALTQIPTLSFVTDLDNLFDPAIGIYVNATYDGRSWERPTSVELIDADGGEGFQIDAGLRIRGGFSRGDFNPKHSFRLFFRSEYGAGKLRFPLFDSEGADRYDAIDLRTAQNYAWSNNTFNDQLQNTFLRDIFSRDLQREQGQAYTRGRYYHLYINGQYWGLYQTEERPEASYASTYFGGEPEDWDAVKASGGQIEATDGDLAAWTTLANLAAAGLGTDAAYYYVQGKNPDGSDNPEYEKHVDVDNLIDLMIGVFFTGNQDMPTALGNGGPNNFWAIRPRDGSHGWRWIAHDNEHNLGTSRDGDPKDDNVYYDETVPTSAGATPASFNPKYLHQQLMAHPEYRVRFADRVHRYFFNDGLMTPSGSQALLDSRSAQIDQAIIGESARWGDQHNEPPLDWNTWQTEVDWLRNTFLSQRTEIVLDQLRADGLYPSGQLDAPSFSLHGGAVPAGFELGITNQESTGVVYYTLDGTDPRETGGDLAPEAIPYEGPISLWQSGPVQARLLRSGLWSALVEADFLVGNLADATNLRITEVNYHPHAALTQFGEADVDNDRFEFVELTNVGTETIRLINTSFTDGIDFTFGDIGLDPGARTVVVRDLAAFESRYGTGLPVAGVFANETGLNNGGETIKLSDAFGGTIVEFDYRDGGRADGMGSTLVVLDTEGDYNRESNWQASIAFGGTPGTQAMVAANVVINEILAHTDPPDLDAVELYNRSDAVMDLSGWWLSDTADDLFKYEFPDGTQLGPDQCLVLDETDFNPGGGAYATDFAFSAAGDTAWLLEANSEGKPIRFADAVAFDATLNGASLGRVPNGDPAWELFPLATPSLGTSNGPYRAGDLIFSEVHYHPAAAPPGSPITEQQLEFVEIYNRSAHSIVLNDSLLGGWRLRGGIDFDFDTLPVGTPIDAGDVLVVVSFDPNETVVADAFRAFYGMDAAVEWVGPYSGQLENSGESVRLLAPTDPPLGVLEPVYYLVDRVTYQDTAPWPEEPDGTGPALSRGAAGNFGDDPASWQAATPTPGAVLFDLLGSGDFDTDGDVDRDDLTIWQVGFGTVAGANLSVGDSDSDGDVDGNDFLAWQNQYGNPSQGGAAAVQANPAQPKTWKLPGTRATAAELPRYRATIQDDDSVYLGRKVVFNENIRDTLFHALGSPCGYIRGNAS